MKILNLIYPDKSEIDFTLTKFPDGQQNITINIDSTTFDLSRLSKIQIKTRLNNWLDLELISCTVASLRELGVEEIHLYIPYIIGARSDRKFEDGGNNYLRDVICPVINSLKFRTVTCTDPHSDVLEACIKGFKKESNVNLLNWAIQEILLSTESNHKDLMLVSPDGGALKKIYETATGAELTCNIVISNKHRDIKTGKLAGFHVPINKDQVNKIAIWVDDICDGGGTFIGEAIEATKNGHTGKKYLVVTHGIFSNRFVELSKYFDGIYCTNSYSNIGDYYGNDMQKTNVKQLNIF